WITHERYLSRTNRCSARERIIKTRLLETEQHDLGLGSHPHRRTPGPGTAGGIYLHFAEPLQSIGKFAKCAAGNEVEGEELSAAMRMSRELQAHTGMFGDRQPIGYMVEEDAW